MTQLVCTQKYDTNRVPTVHTLAPTNTDLTNTPSTLAHVAHTTGLNYRGACMTLEMGGWLDQ